MLMDKGYYDYDYQKMKPVLRRKTYEESVRSDEEIRNILSRFGWGKPKEKPLTPAELQAEIMTEEKKKRAAR